MHGEKHNGPDRIQSSCFDYIQDGKVFGCSSKRDINRFKPNRISFFYQFDQTISILRVLGGIIHFYSNFNRSFCKQTVEGIVRRLRSGSALFAYVQQKWR